MDQEIVKLKTKKFKTALVRLKESIDVYRGDESDDKIRDSVIKRFEFCFDLCWKTARLVLSYKYGNNTASPKETYRILRQNNLINDKFTELFLQMTDDRNTIVHEYSEDFSKGLAQKVIDHYYGAMVKVSKI